MMFSKRPLPVPSTVLSAPSPAAIAASIRRPAAVQLAEMRLEKLRGERQAASDQQRSLIHEFHGRTDALSEAAEKKVTQLQRALEDLDDEIGMLRREHAPARARHGADVAAALAPMHRAAAARIVAALAAVRADMNLLSECADAARAAGGDLSDVTGFSNLGAIEATARAIAGAAE